jgi:hypothetical protein
MPDKTDVVVIWPDDPEWACPIAGDNLNLLISLGLLAHSERHDWRAVQTAVVVLLGAVCEDPNMKSELERRVLAKPRGDNWLAALLK